MGLLGEYMSNRNDKEFRPTRIVIDHATPPSGNAIMGYPYKVNWKTAMSEYLDFHADLNNPENVSVWDELTLWSSAFAQLLLKYIPLERNMKVLDVGCGTGVPLLELAERLGSTCKVYGIDLWRTALDRAVMKTKVRNVLDVTIVEGDASVMPFKDGQFDLVVSNLGINNFEKPEAAFSECWRVAKPSARLVLTTNLKGHMGEFYDAFRSTLVELNKKTLLEKLNLQEDHRVTIQRLHDMLEGAGFSIAKVHEDTFSMRFLDGSSFFRHYLVKVGFLDGWKNVIEPQDQPDVFSALERDLNQLAETKGELELTIPMAYVEAEKIV